MVGLANSGKTTVSKHLVGMLPRTVRIECDEVGRIVKDIKPVEDDVLIIL